MYLLYSTLQLDLVFSTVDTDDKYAKKHAIAHIQYFYSTAISFIQYIADRVT